MKFSPIRSLIYLCCILLLSGCMYPKTELKKNQVPSEDQIHMVQQAIDTYHSEENGRLPIKTKPNDTPVFEKYLIDFDGLIQNGYLSSIPGNAFENGGFYQYALMDVEDNPTVKLIDLRTAEKIRSLNTRIEIYRSKHTYPPFGEKIIDGVYRVDHEKLNLDHEPTVNSPYSEHLLPLVMDGNGKVYIDYRKDLREYLENNPNAYQFGDDIRYLLAEKTPVLPAFSLPYTVNEKNDPVFKTEKSS